MPPDYTSRWPSLPDYTGASCQGRFDAGKQWLVSLQGDTFILTQPNGAGDGPHVALIKRQKREPINSAWMRALIVADEKIKELGHAA